MPKDKRGGKRNAVLANVNDNSDSKSAVEELRYYVDENGTKRFDGVDGWKLSYNTHSQVEKEDAIWLQDVLGETVYLNPKVELPKGITSYDYITENGIKIEQKGPSNQIGKNKIERLVNQGKKQASILLINITGLNLSKKSIERQIKNSLYKNNSRHYVNQIIVKDGIKLIGIYTKKRRPLA